MIYTKHMTRAALASTGLFTSLGDGIGIYTSDMQPVPLPEDPDERGQIPLQFYEVSAPLEGGGSWWLPVSTVPDLTATKAGFVWGDWMPLKAWGGITTEHMLRPAEHWCWMPVGLVEQAIGLTEIYGTINGDHPNAPPA